MSKARLVITAVILEHRQQAEVARSYGVSESWVSKLIARYRAEGDAAFEPRSRRPKTTPGVLPAATVELILRLRKELSDDEEMAPRPTRPTRHDHRTPSTPRPLRRRRQPPPAAPVLAAPSHPGGALRHHAQGHPRRLPRPRHPQSDPPRHRRQSRLRNAAPQRPTAPHRHRPNPRGNLRHPSSRTSRSESSTPSPENCSASSSSTPPRTTSPRAHPKAPPDHETPEPEGSRVSDHLRDHTAPPAVCWFRT